MFSPHQTSDSVLPGENKTIENITVLFNALSLFNLHNTHLAHFFSKFLALWLTIYPSCATADSKYLKYRPFV